MIAFFIASSKMENSRPRPETLLKKGLHARCLPVTFERFFRSSIYSITAEGQKWEM